eukprot:2863179-Prymnesium_polylepis.1
MARRAGAPRADVIGVSVGQGPRGCAPTVFYKRVGMWVYGAGCPVKRELYGLTRLASHSLGHFNR